MKRTKMPAIAEIASTQWGMVTAAQARAIGVDGRTVAGHAATGDLARLAHGIYRLAGTPPGPFDELRVAWLSFDPSRTAAERIAGVQIEVVSHRSAAQVQQLGDIDADIMEFTVPTRRQTRRHDVRIHLGSVDQGDWQLVDGLPVTTPLRTIIDLAATHIDQGHLAGIVRDATSQHGLPVRRIASALAIHARAYDARAGNGHELVSRLLRQAGVPSSAIELVMYASPTHRSPWSTV